MGFDTNSVQAKTTKIVLDTVWGEAGLTTMRGFLPQQSPYCLAQSEMAGLNSLLDSMPVIKKDGTPGLLAKNEFRQAALELPDHSAVFQSWAAALTTDISPEQKTQHAMDLAVAFRDYQYLKMGALFEPVQSGSLQASTVLPSNIANPLVFLASIFDQKPWLEYASGYVLMNSVFTDEISADKVQLIRQWHGGPDEFYFQTVHSIIEWETPALFKAIDQLIRGVELDDAQMVVSAMEQGIKTSELMLKGLKQMTRLSRPAYYAADVRPQIQGLKGNCGEGKLFPAQGVCFDSRFFVDEQSKMLSEIRGQTGAQSSIIPLLDNILGITDFYAKGDNPLTAMLREFRAYRPKPHTALLARVEQEQQRLSIRQYLKERQPLLLARWTGVVCQFREFHFYLAMAYIVKPGKAQPKAQSRAIGTGGSPTPKYLPQHVNESLIALNEALRCVRGDDLNQAEQTVFDYWSDYYQQTLEANAARSTSVAEYLDQTKTEQDLDKVISTTQDKIESDEVFVG